MNFKELQSFIAISKYKNFSKAAKSLYITQPTISHHIQTLEEDLNTTILSRNSKTVSLTKAGQMLLVHAQKILNEKEQIHFMFDLYNGDISGILEIATSTIPAQHYLPNIINNFAVEYPKMKFKITKLDTAEVHKKLSSSEIDFGIVGAMSNFSNFGYEKILKDEIVLCCSYNTEINSTIDIKKLLDLSFIIREEGSATRKHMLSCLREKNIELADLNIFAEIDDTDTIISCLRNSNKFSFISRVAISEEVERKNIKIIVINDFEIIRNFYFVYNSNHILTPLSKAFKDFILKLKK